MAQTSADSVQNIEQLISEINILVKDAVGQAASSEEILASSDTMVEQANNITGNSESVASGAQELTASAEELANQVKIFKIK